MPDRTSASLDIAAPAGVLMGIIADFAAYPRWVDTIRSAEVVRQGPDGRAATVRFQLEAGPIKDSYVLGYQWENDRAVRWDVTERGTMISELSGAYLLADQGPQTAVTYQLSVGLAVPLPGMIKRRAEKAIIDAALKGLARRAQEVSEGEVR
jgi:Polyketide cyclase / dehydrase and lipid transport